MNRRFSIIPIQLLFITALFASCSQLKEDTPLVSESRIRINEGWRFFKYSANEEADTLYYELRPEIIDRNDDKPADAKPTEAYRTDQDEISGLKPWIMPTGNPFIKETSRHYKRPEGDPGIDFEFTFTDFDDSDWEPVDLPHDWAIGGPFQEGPNTEVGGGMGRLPSPGIAWYRRKLEIPASLSERSVFLDIDGAMSYAMVWINGHLAGGWPYGYSSWRVDLSPYIEFGGENQLAIRLDNPPNSSRWYPGGGLYRNVWLTIDEKIRVAHWGTYLTTKAIIDDQAKLELEVTLENRTKVDQEVRVETSIFKADSMGDTSGASKGKFPDTTLILRKGSSNRIRLETELKNPELWGPPPNQSPNRYTAVTTVFANGKVTDRYHTSFGIREIIFDAEKGLIVNGEQIYLKGVNQHHDLGALGAAFNERAAERQLLKLKELGANAIRMAHNPPAPELLELTDRMGFLVIDEIYDGWERKKTPLDFHLIFPEWHEQDVRAWIRRDRNSPSVILWSTGNEVGEQYTDSAGAKIAARLRKIVHEEDPYRLTSASFNYAKPEMPITAEMEVINLNYQGEGIRNATAYAHLKGINTAPLYPAFHKKFPNKTIISSENAAALSSRGTYIFPVTPGISAPVSDTTGGDPIHKYVSAFELYTAPFGSSADKVFASLDKHPYVAGGFVWSGWDYLGEPTPYYSSRSSYYGLIDLAGFEKDRFYLYQAKWRPNLPMVHILPHWNWPDRIGKITPVHVFTTGDEVELFLNEKSLGKRSRKPFQYRLRWDNVVYEPGILRAVSYKNGEQWAETTIATTGKSSGIKTTVDRDHIAADGVDIAFIEVRITDTEGRTVPDASDLLTFTLQGPGSIVATDNGDPTDMTSFRDTKRKAFNGKALVIVKFDKDASGPLKINISSTATESTEVLINVKESP
ncbi:beta-galactosidase GalB [Robertkochia solimangrovi]|uniref:beta-galactosidase GalB n=1 Tax=Robertkochia solimangrovi TaxID=2213046 RepID=UPI00117DDE5D|nr:beta-galactosidase GalB [Robertkochia solimangrovi]TRZ42039.1 beta-galactosidase [Robertkochia solimangrovi]